MLKTLLPRRLLGASIDTRVRYQDLNAGNLDIRLGDSVFGRVMLSW
ncbi:hypothetical protein [Marinobacter sp. LQ44]|nr:hypothetical protein [Marinobacter sp. LQ44]